MPLANLASLMLLEQPWLLERRPIIYVRRVIIVIILQLLFSRAVLLELICPDTVQLLQQNV